MIDMSRQIVKSRVRRVAPVDHEVLVVGAAGLAGRRVVAALRQAGVHDGAALICDRVGEAAFDPDGHRWVVLADGPGPAPVSGRWLITVGPLPIRGRHGRELEEGARGYGDVSHPGFPNLFTLGPAAVSAGQSAVSARHAARVIAGAGARGATYAEVRRAPHRRWLEPGTGVCWEAARWWEGRHFPLDHYRFRTLPGPPKDAA